MGAGSHRSVKKASRGDKAEGTREFVLEVLNFLYPQFQRIGSYRSAAPYLDHLMTITYGPLPARITSAREFQGRTKTRAGTVKADSSKATTGVGS